MKDKKNGSGHDPDDKIVHLPTLAERDRMRKEKQQKEKAASKPVKVPFLNISKIPIFTRILVGAFLLVHIPIFVLFTSGQKLEAFYMLGFVPGYFTGAAGGMPWFAPTGIITHMFIHGSWMHLLFNITMTLAMGMFFEMNFGTRTTVKFFFVCGVAGALIYFILNPFSTVPVIGASGGISGLFGAVLVELYQRGQIGGIGKRGPLPIIIFWLVFMVITGMLSGDNMAWQAHVGGFLAGIGLLHLMKKGKVRL